MAFLADVMGATTGLGESGETYLVSAADRYLVTPSRFDGYPANRAYHSAGIDRALAREDGVDTYANYQEPPVTVIGVYRWLPKLQAAMLAEVAEVEALAAAQESLLSSIAVAALAALVSAGVSLFAVSYLTRPLSQLARVATQVAQGNLHLRARVGQQNEVGQVAAAFNSMADQFTNLIDTLEHRVTARTRDIATIAEIGRIATQIHDVDVLLPRMVNLIQQAFGFYHVQLFMLDDSGRYAVLKASTGEAGEELLRRRHSLTVGSQSVIGQVTLTGDPVIALDTEGADVIHRPNALLPDTRSEMALALRIGNRIVGALDVQSVEPNAFDQDHVSVFQGMADQIAVAINNAALLGESEARLRQIEQLNRQLVGDTWRRHMQNYANGTLAFTADPGGMQPAGEATPTQTRALTSGEPVIQRRDEGIHVALPSGMAGR
ncbi:MAG: GAF domain-containing protein [Anaerolineae bacterium]|nr:GAF domain-containing protein [Anaerolineae bacterium]